MPLQLEHHHAADRSLPRPIPATVALFGTLLFVLVPLGSAQSHTSASSTSGHAAASTPAARSTSLQSSSPARTASSAGASRNNQTGRRSRGYWRGGVYYPYVTGAADSSNATGNNEAECQGGPTIFDRCSSNPNYIPPTNAGPAHASASSQAFAGPAADSTADATSPTTLVFKDGHELEVDNYAVAGQTLYDLTPGRSQKIALSDLDLNATQKQNADHGPLFQPQPSAHSN